MKFTTKLLTLLLVLMMLVQSSLVTVFAVVPSIDVDTSVLEAAPRYDEASDVQYKTSGKYIYNWGIREEDATFLTTYAVDFYEDANVDFDDLEALAGGTQSSAPSSALYKKLQSIMKNAQTHTTSYAETKNLYRYTDCTGESNKISSFYSGKSIGPDWDGTWNREHTWPNSKGDGDAENDIMMLRPTSTSENSSRGNTAYGKSSSYYNPNSESGGKHDLRGDVARICLYVYVRWGNTSRMWGSGGVMESLPVLLLWMEEDPVDTWELGRNDSVQAITGTRNVFVDYPELAWLLFSEEVPDDMVTPSGEASDGVLGGGNGGSTGGNTGSDDNTGSGNTGSGNTGNDNPGGNQGGNSGSTTPNTSSKVELTVDSLNLKSQEYSSSSATVGGVGFEWIQLGNYGNGIQVRDKDGKTSSFWNTTAFSSPIVKIEMVYSSTKDITHSNPDCEIFSFGNGVDNYTSTVKLSTTEGVKTYTITPDAQTYTYFKFEHDLGYSMYWESITIVLVDGTTVNPGQGGNQSGSSDDSSAVKEFKTVVAELNGLKGEALFDKICEALTAYSNLSESEKSSVSSQYATLTTVIEDYNDTVNGVNEDIENVQAKILGAVALTLSSLSLAYFGLFGKKFF